MSLIEVNDLTFCYDGSYDNVFENVSFRFDTSWKIGFVGRNGRGKTTFLKLLQKKFEYQGNIKSTVKFDYFPFIVNDKSKITIDLIGEIYSDYELWKVCKELNNMELSEEALYRSFDTLSNGEQTKILLALLFSKGNNFLLIDEPTNHLDASTREEVGRYLKTKKGFLLVSHDRHFLDACVDYILALNKSTIDVIKGNFTTWFNNKKNLDFNEMKNNDRLKNDIKRLNEAAIRSSKWSEKCEESKKQSNVTDKGYVGHKASKMMKRAKVIERRIDKAVEEKAKLLKNIENVDVLKMSPLKHYKDIIIDIQNFMIGYDGRSVCDNINFSVSQRERVVLNGKNGSGKSSILKAIIGQVEFTGTIKLASGLIISYIPQDTSFLKGTLDEFAVNSNIDITLFKTVLRQLDFSRIQFEKKIDTFSEGQKKKVLLAKSICENAHIYIWDEPLNYIDVFSRIQIENLILQYEPTMMLVEHDKLFLDKISTKMINL